MNKNDYLKTEGRFDGAAFKPDGGWLQCTPNGKWKVVVGCKVTDDVTEEGKCAFWDGWLTTENAQKNTVKVLVEAFGFNGDFSALESGKITFQDMPCSFETENETYNGKTFLKVKWLNHINRKSTVPAAASDQVKAFIATINAQTKAMAMGNQDDVLF